MAHIFLGYLHKGLSAALDRKPTEEEWDRAIKAIQDYAGKDVFVVEMKREEK